MSNSTKINPLTLRTTPLESRNGRLHLDDRVLILYQDDEWRPARPDTLGSFWKSAPPDQRANLVGLWRDRWRWAIIPPDGRIQPDEIETLAQRWAKEQHLATSATSHLAGQPCEWLSLYGQVVPSQASLDSRQLVEPIKVTSCQREKVIQWGWHPKSLGRYPLNTTIRV